MLLLLLLAAFTALPPAADPAPDRPVAHAVAADTTLRVMSFNLRLNLASDGADAWPHRRDGVARLIQRYEPDIIGVQEAQRPMLDDLSDRLPAFEWVGVGREPGDSLTEYSALLYRPERVELLEHDTFWLSETPEQPGSRGWDAALPRIATWGRFRDRTTGDLFFAANTHFDHVGETARAESARLLRSRLRTIAGEAPLILTGDFNAVPDSKPYRRLTGTDAPDLALRDAYRSATRGHSGPSSTWNGFATVEPGRRIDFIFTAGPIEVIHHRVLDDRLPNDRFPSDHLPVLATMRLILE